MSMTENGDPYENAIAERVNGILKYEFNLNQEFPDRKQALMAVDKSINAYNQLRPHMSCNYHTPKEAHQMKGPFEKKWKSYKKEIKTEMKVETS
ncbi:MAG: integrase core domain-containing protein [Bacteroidota bacterium]|nr:integrase core domain-containing protein [Bacteroidota bacterium]